MATIYDSLEAYCQEHLTEMPKSNEVSALGKRIALFIREKQGGSYTQLNKVEHTYVAWVNDYPEEYTPLISQAIVEFYENRVKFFNQLAKAEELKIKKLNFDINECDSKDFEDAAKGADVGVHKNGSRNGTAQYRLSFRKYQQLVNLGILLGRKLASSVETKKEKSEPVLEVQDAQPKPIYRQRIPKKYSR